ncbi:MAG: hypothetical protein RJA70_1633 [Pseudomonadota bacterium]|jgi:hypothetical protein
MATMREMNWARGAYAVAVWLSLGTLPGCSDERKLEDTVDSKPGLSQPAAGNGPLLDEAEACTLMTAALSGRKSSLDCDGVNIAVCPSLIRPAGSLACARYTKASVDACVEQIGEYKACGDFRLRTCFVTAVAEEKSAGCVPPGPPTGPDAGAPDSGADGGEPAPDASAGIVPVPTDAGTDAAAPVADAAPGDAGL